MQIAAGCIALLSSASLLQPAVAFVSSGRPAWDSPPPTVTSFPRSSKDSTAQLRRREAAAARRRGQAGTDLSALPVLESLSLFDALPTDASSAVSAASSTSSLLGSIANAEAMDALTEASTKSTSVHSDFELLEFAELWSVLAMTCIVALLVAWEESVEKIIHNTPKQIKPVIDSMLAEVGGLGFIGLFLSTIVVGGPLGSIVEQISERFLDDGELLLETFEFLHTFFFQVGILFFAISGIVVGAVLKEVSELGQISELALDADGDGEVTLDELADALNVESMIVDLDGDGVIDEYEIGEALRVVSERDGNVLVEEYSTTEAERAAECLVIRQRMLEELGLPQTFKIEEYFAEIFGEDLEEFVELSPVTWLPLIPLIAISNSVDIRNHVVSASSSNAFDSCGYFFESPLNLYSTIVLQIVGLAWALFNFWKMASIKRMLVPTLVKGSEVGEAILLPPRYMDDHLRDQFNSSPAWVAWIERRLTDGGDKKYPSQNQHEELFGAVGSKFPEAYRDSIRFHTWLSVAQITYFTTQIVLRDASALLGGVAGRVDNPNAVASELILWSIFTASSIFELSLAPTTFLDYCFVTSVEKFVKKDIIDKTLMEEECLIVEDLIGQSINGFDTIQPKDTGFEPEMQEKMRRLGATASYLYNLKHHQAEEELRPVSLTSSYLGDLGVSKREADAMDEAFEDAKTLSNQF